jgi:cell wall-associated NlpC family hydrolase
MDRPFSSISKAITLLLLVVFLVTTSLTTVPAAQESQNKATLVNTRTRLEKLLHQYLGIPYHRGGATKKGMDCSGFARTIYRQLFGLELPHNSGDQYHLPILKKVVTRLQAGDLLFFARKKKINHVAIYLANNKFIHASSSAGITISSLDEGYWKKRFIGAKRVPRSSSPDSGLAATLSAGNNDSVTDQLVDLSDTEKS